MKTALLFDIDNTLTPPRQQLTPQMAEVIKRLRVPFHVAAGSHLEMLLGQFFEPLYGFGFRRAFDAFLSNGAIHYHCDFAGEMSIAVVSEFNIREHLGEADYRSVVEALEATLARPEFVLPPRIKIIGDRVVFRNSMINFCPIGRTGFQSEEYQRSRREFVEFDNASGYRRRLMDHLRDLLRPQMSELGLTITLGGQTSFDIGVAEQDKTVAVRKLLVEGFEQVVFIGDALYEGGNDAPLREFVMRWTAPTPCPLRVIQVDGWEDARAKLYELDFVG
jgi:phosphomannomutase